MRGAALVQNAGHEPRRGNDRGSRQQPAYSQVTAASMAETIRSRTPSKISIRSMLMSVV